MQEQTVPVSLEYKIHTLCSNFNVKQFLGAYFWS